MLVFSAVWWMPSSGLPCTTLAVAGAPTPGEEVVAAATLLQGELLTATTPAQMRISAVTRWSYRGTSHGDGILPSPWPVHLPLWQRWVLVGVHAGDAANFPNSGTTAGTPPPRNDRCTP